MDRLAFVWDPEKPLARSEAETLNAWAALVDYAHMGPGRSLEALTLTYQSATGARPTKRIATLKDWSANYAWQARVAAFDEAEAERQTEKYRERSDRALDDLMTLADTYRGKVKIMVDGYSWDIASHGQVALALKTATEATLKAYRVPEKKEIAGPDGGPLQLVDLTNLDDERYREYLRSLIAATRSTD